MIAGAAARATPPDSTGAAASAASAPSSAAVRATRGASAACGYPGASSPRLHHAVTSKVRRLPIEGDPCAGAVSAAPPPAR